MLRRHGNLLPIAALASLYLAASCAGPKSTEITPAALEASPPPNILLMVVEDLSPRIGAFDDTVARTPNLDRLAQEGIRFTNTYTAAGVCAPSRSALITGMHQHTIGTQHMRTASYDRIIPEGFKYKAVPPSHVKGFPEYMRAGGYFTLNNNKTDYQFGAPTSIWDLSGKEVKLADKAHDKPFFMMLSEGSTHESGLFQKGLAPKQPLNPQFAYRADSIAKKAAQNFNSLSELKHRTPHHAVTVPAYLPDTPMVRQEIAIQYDQVQKMDAWVGDILAQLEDQGLMDDRSWRWNFTRETHALRLRFKSPYDREISR